jgi:hypothetical protein
MRSSRFVLLTVVALALVAGCGSSKPVAGAAQAKAACATFATLAADEQAQAASEATTASELSDGSGDDSGDDALAGTEGLTTTGSFKIIGDCVSLGLPVTQK